MAGGRQIVDFLDETLEQNISKELNLPDDAGIPERVARAFLITDMQSRRCGIMTWNYYQPKSVYILSRLEITTSGATAVVALLVSRYPANHNNNNNHFIATILASLASRWYREKYTRRKCWGQPSCSMLREIW